MAYYTFENSELKDDAFYDLFEKTLINTSALKSLTPHLVTYEQQGRLHAVCSYLHNTTEYTEELMAINNLYSPYSIVMGDLIYYCEDANEYNNMHISDADNSEDIKDEILNKNKNKSTTKDPNRIGYAPTIKPDNIKQLNIDYTSKQITIINKLS